MPRPASARSKAPRPPLPTRQGKLAVGVSIGEASLGEGETQIGEVIARADAAMPVEKRAGGRAFMTVG